MNWAISMTVKKSMDGNNKEEFIMEKIPYCGQDYPDDRGTVYCDNCKYWRNEWHPYCSYWEHHPEGESEEAEKEENK